MTELLPPTRRALLALTTAAALAVSGCATGDPNAQQSSAATATGAAVPLPTQVPSVQPGATVDPHEFAKQMRGAMQSAENYEYTTTSTLSDPKAPAAPAVRTVVDQTDVNKPKIRTETTSKDVTSTMIIVDGTQYLRAGSGKYQKMPVPPESAQSMVAVGSDVEHAKTVTYVGPDNVEAQLARHYRADLPPQSGGSGEQMTYDVWLDAQGRLIKQVTVMSALTSTQVYSNYGTAPAVSAPDPSEIEG